MFFFTLIVSFSVTAVQSKTGQGMNEAEAYREKACFIALYAYLMDEKAIRTPGQNYLLIATLNDAKALQKHASEDDVKKSQQKQMKNFDKNIVGLGVKVERSLKDIQERLDHMDDQKRDRQGRSPATK